jgi:hypothetical protein
MEKGKKRNEIIVTHNHLFVFIVHSKIVVCIYYSWESYLSCPTFWTFMVLYKNSKYYSKRCASAVICGRRAFIVVVVVVVRPKKKIGRTNPTSRQKISSPVGARYVCVVTRRNANRSTKCEASSRPTP